MVELKLPLSPSWKLVAESRAHEVLPAELTMPKVREISDSLLAPVRRLIQNCSSTYRSALKDPTNYQPLLKDFRRPFMHALTVHQFCGESKEPPVSLRSFVHEAGELNDFLRQGQTRLKKETTTLYELFEVLRDEKDSILKFPIISQRKFLTRITRRREELQHQCDTPTRVFTPQEFHALRYDLRQLMYLHRGAWKASEPVSDEHFRVFLHLLQLSERMGDLNDKLIDTEEDEPMFLAPRDREDLLLYLGVKIM